MLFLILMLASCGGGIDNTNKGRQIILKLLKDRANPNEIKLAFNGNRSKISLSTPKSKKAQEMLDKLNESSNFPFSTFNIAYSKVSEIEKLYKRVRGSNGGDFFSNNNNRVTKEEAERIISDYYKSLSEFDNECTVENIDEDLVEYVKCNLLNALNDIGMIGSKMHSTEASEQFNANLDQENIATMQRMENFTREFDEKKRAFDETFNKQG